VVEKRSFGRTKFGDSGVDKIHALSDAYGRRLSVIVPKSVGANSTYDLLYDLLRLSRASLKTQHIVLGKFSHNLWDNY